jgi:putative transposase
MPDHVHLLLTPNEITLERTMQLIKGGFSHRLSSKSPVWQRGFTDKRIRDREDFLTHREYIHHNPVRDRLCQLPEDYPFSSAHVGCRLPGAPFMPTLSAWVGSRSAEGPRVPDELARWGGRSS